MSLKAASCTKVPAQVQSPVVGQQVGILQQLQPHHRTSPQPLLLSELALAAAKWAARVAGHLIPQQQQQLTAATAAPAALLFREIMLQLVAQCEKVHVRRLCILWTSRARAAPPCPPVAVASRRGGMRGKEVEDVNLGAWKEAGEGAKTLSVAVVTSPPGRHLWQ